MTSEEDGFLKRLVATFRVEAAEHIHAIAAGLSALSKSDRGEPFLAAVESMLREAHSLKGAARSVNRTEIEALCTSLEGLFAAMKRGEVEPSPGLVDLLNRALDEIEGRVGTEGEAHRESGLSNLVQELAGAARPMGGANASVEGAAERSSARLPPRASGPQPGNRAASGSTAAEARQAETVRVSSSRVDRLLLQSEELLSVRLALAERVGEAHGMTTEIARWRREWRGLTPRLRAARRELTTEGAISEGRGRELERLFDRIESFEVFGRSIEERASGIARATERDFRSLTSMMDGLLEGTREMLRSPLSPLFEVLPKLVRDLARELGKEVEVVVSGGDIEVDRRILQELKDPLIHLVRNAVDHGIEPSEERRRRNKPSRGRVAISASSRVSDRVEIAVTDDGAGIDRARLRAAIEKLGLVTHEAVEALDEGELFEFALRSGVSTSPIITDLSGRGLGLAIVREKVERLGGSVLLESEQGGGTACRMMLPMAMATFHALIVELDSQSFAIPAVHVERVARVSHGEIQTVENRETVRLGGGPVSLVSLADVLELPARSTNKEGSANRQVVLLRAEGKRIAFQVDEVVAEQEVVVKPIAPPLVRVRNVDGATVLGNGKVIPVLNVSDLMESAVKRASAPRRQAGLLEPQEEASKPVLVVEDSITARTLLASILRGAGYAVETAVDGVDALTKLKTGEFALVVSDVDMPRMNGFDLTSKIRSDKRLSDLPVVLVTALESREDRERGIDVGANAYIVKSSFEQSNLLGAVQRFV